MSSWSARTVRRTRALLCSYAATHFALCASGYPATISSISAGVNATPASRNTFSNMAYDIGIDAMNTGTTFISNQNGKRRATDHTVDDELSHQPSLGRSMWITFAFGCATRISSQQAETGKSVPAV